MDIKLKDLVMLTGGEIVDDIFVTKAGIKLYSKTDLCLEQDVIDFFNVDKDKSNSEKMLEINSKVTYLNTNEVNDGYIDKIFNQYKHRSIANNIHIGFLLAGVSSETLLEFVSSTANICRLTTSRTVANNDTLYNIKDKNVIPYINQFLSIRENYKEEANNIKATNKKDVIEIINNFNLFTKASAFIVSMSLQDWVSYVDSKINNDYELEFKEICIRIKGILKELYPEIL